MRICLAGTFNSLHLGHKKLIDIAIQSAGQNGKVFIGLTKGDLLTKKKYHIPYEERKKEILDYMNKKKFRNFEILPIYSIYGLAVDGDYDAIIVSPETKNNAHEINEERILKHKNPLKIIAIPYILAKDNSPISSTRILNGEIDRNGNILKN